VLHVVHFRRTERSWSREAVANPRWRIQRLVGCRMRLADPTFWQAGPGERQQILRVGYDRFEEAISHSPASAPTPLLFGDDAKVLRYARCARARRITPTITPIS
jgi:hypothetical protein